MAIVSGGLHGTVVKSVGAVTYSRWNGIQVAKSKATQVANPKTEAQQANRGQMTNCTKYGKNFNATVIKPMFDRFADKSTGWADWISLNKALFDDFSPIPAADMITANGSLASQPLLTTTAFIADAVIQITWEQTTTGGGREATDSIYVVAELKGVAAADPFIYVFGIGGTVKRNLGALTVTLPVDIVAGNVFNVWTSFGRPDLTAVDKSIYTEVTAQVAP